MRSKRIDHKNVDRICRHLLKENKNKPVESLVDFSSKFHKVKNWLGKDVKKKINGY